MVVTKGSAPTLAINVNPAKNRITTAGYGYDSNGNLTAAPFQTLTCDVENRMVQAVHSLNGTERYVYDPSNLRVWKQEPSRTLVYFFGVEGTLLATYGDQSNPDYNVYFGGKLIWAEASTGFAAGPLGMDRLGSVVSRNGTANRYFPYGQEPTATGEDRTKFATYHRDVTTSLDYAHNRYYSSSIARFTRVDPLGGHLANPQSLNRYVYLGGDPVNFHDPAGLLRAAPPIRTVNSGREKPAVRPGKASAARNYHRRPRLKPEAVQIKTSRSATRRGRPPYVASQLALCSPRSMVSMLLRTVYFW